MKVALVGTPAEVPAHGEASPEVVSKAPVAVHAAARHSQMGVAVGVLAIIALIAALYLARAFFVPFLIGILASYALHPLVDWLKACHVPRAAGAALVLALVVGSLSWIGFSLSGDATAVIETLPDAARKLRQNLSLSLIHI